MSASRVSIAALCAWITAGLVSLQQADALSPEASADYAQSLSLNGIRFDISSASLNARHHLRIEPHGLSHDNTVIEQEIPGPVLRAELADLDGDQSPEVYVYLRVGAATELVAFAANRKRSLSGIYLPPISEVPGADHGYLGDQEMAIEGARFVRRFHIDGGARVRVLAYRLVPGEAGWLLRFDRLSES